jgi:hypothetical protein
MCFPIPTQAPLGRVLVHRMSAECDGAGCQVDDCQQRRNFPDQGEQQIQAQEGREGEAQGHRPVGGRLIPADREPGGRQGGFDLTGLCLAFRSDFQLESDALLDLRSFATGSEGGGPDEDILAALSGFDEAEATLFIPGFQNAICTH